jgi:hypothetical protein
VPAYQVFESGQGVHGDPSADWLQAEVERAASAYWPERRIRSIAVDTIFRSAHPGFRRDPMT